MFKAKIIATIFWVYNINRGKEYKKRVKIRRGVNLKNMYFCKVLT